jgi:hypothetical protein
MVGQLKRFGLVALLVIGAAVLASLAGDWSRREASSLVDTATLHGTPPHDRAGGAPVAAPAVPSLALDRLGRRSARITPGDPFQSRGWIVAREKPPETPPARVVQAPPPLPFSYLGKWMEQDRVTVLLGREGRTYVAHAGDLLDGAYHVDRIEPTRVTLTFLPLGLAQTLDFGQARMQPAAATVASASADAVLHVAIPQQAVVADEFSILLSLDPVQTALIARGTIEVRYDPRVLHVIAAGSTRMPLTPNEPGRIAVELGGGYIGHSGPASAVRLRVVADAPTTTQLRFATLLATDAEERNLRVAIDGANPRPIAIVAGASPK